MATEGAEKILERLCAGTDDARPCPDVALIAAHPDDEVIGAGARLPRWRAGHLLHVTDGAPRDLRDARALGFATREDYARARRGELLGALTRAGLRPEQAMELGIVDREASLDLPGLSRMLEDWLARLRPEVVVTHPYEGGHPDHDATAFAVHAACRRLRDQGGTPPQIVEMTSYHAGPGAMMECDFLPCGECPAVKTVVLSEAERTFKRGLFACFPTQRAVLRWFPIVVERFRPAPRYDFIRPPHPGPLYYEQHFDWGMTGDHWRRLAAEALHSLRLGGT